MDQKDLWMSTEREVARIGIPVSYKGYYYLILAIVLSVNTGLRKASLSKEIYPAIADMNDVSLSSVERDIRHALLRAWTDDSGLLRKAYPGYAARPTNGEVIAFITSRIRLETRPGI